MGPSPPAGDSLGNAKSEQSPVLVRSRWGHVSLTGAGVRIHPPPSSISRGPRRASVRVVAGGSVAPFPGRRGARAPCPTSPPENGSTRFLLAPSLLRDRARQRRAVFAGRLPRGVGRRFLRPSTFAPADGPQDARRVNESRDGRFRQGRGRRSPVLGHSCTFPGEAPGGRPLSALPLGKRGGL